MKKSNTAWLVVQTDQATSTFSSPAAPRPVGAPRARQNFGLHKGASFLREPLFNRGDHCLPPWHGAGSR
jgi:hypothetical protein